MLLMLLSLELYEYRASSTAALLKIVSIGSCMKTSVYVCTI